jgi:hypothetical protein
MNYTQWTQKYQMATKIPNGHKIDQTVIKYTYQHVPLQDPTKFTQICIFGSKIYHLATMLSTGFDDQKPLVTNNIYSNGSVTTIVLSVLFYV